MARPGDQHADGASTPAEDAVTGREASTGGRAASAPADVFGDVLPDVTSDERAEGLDWREAERDDRDEWLRGEVPPHH